MYTATVRFLPGFTAPMNGMHAWIALDATSRTFRLASDDDRPCPVAATGVEHGTIRTFSL